MPRLIYAYTQSCKAWGFAMDTKLLNGTVEMLILDVVSHGPSYGYEITQTVSSPARRGQFELKEGSLYPALHRLERQRAAQFLLDRARWPPPQVLQADDCGAKGASRHDARSGSHLRRG